MSIVAEFFESDEGRGSMTRLLMFLAFWPATYILYINRNSQSIPELVAYYLGAFALGYIGGKFSDARKFSPGKDSM